MKFTFTLTVEVERVSGKFAPKDEIEQWLLDEIVSADPGEVSGVGADGDTEYEVISWEVTP